MCWKSPQKLILGTQYMGSMGPAFRIAQTKPPWPTMFDSYRREPIFIFLIWLGMGWDQSSVTAMHHETVCHISATLWGLDDHPGSENLAPYHSARWIQCYLLSNFPRNTANIMARSGGFIPGDLLRTKSTLLCRSFTFFARLGGQRKLYLWSTLTKKKWKKLTIS